MQDPVSMWRVELLHPFTVHVPIALLIFGSIFWLSSLYLHQRYSFLRPSARLMLLIGTIGAWVAVYTGVLADGQVGRTLCDPIVANDHERLAFAVSYIFSAFLVVECLYLEKYITFLNGKWMRTGLAILLIVGCGILGYVGHLGAQLVYQQSAGVYQPTERCVEFQ